MSRYTAPSDLDYSAAIGADQDERIALEEQKAREDAFRGDRGALLHLLRAEVERIRRSASSVVSDAVILLWFVHVLGEADDTPDPTAQVVRTFTDLWGVGPAVAVLGAAMAEVNGDSFNEARR